MTLLGLLAMGVCLRIAISDLYARRVPNTWLLAACAIAVPLIIAGQFNATRTAWAPHLLGAVVGLLALLPFYAVRWMGAGDVKFFAVLGLPVWAGRHCCRCGCWPAWPQAPTPCWCWPVGSWPVTCRCACRCR